MAVPEPLTRKEKFWADIIEYRGGGGGGDDDWSIIVNVLVDENTMNPKLGMNLNGDALIDWGDGATSETSGEGGYVSTSHEYGSVGEYSVKVKITGEAHLVSETTGGGGTAYPSLWQSAADAPSVAYPYRMLSVDIKDGVTTIETKAFQNCTGLTNVTMRGVTSIDNNAFINCSGLTSVTIPDSVTSLGNRAFSGCSSLTSVTIGDGVTSIGGGSFSECTSLTSVSLPDVVTTIGNAGFRGCTSLTSITIPDSVTSIEGNAFLNCTSLESIHFKPTTPPAVTNKTAWIKIPTTCIIYVPSGSLAAYTSATNYPDPATYTYVEE